MNKHPNPAGRPREFSNIAEVFGELDKVERKLKSLSHRKQYLKHLLKREYAEYQHVPNIGVSLHRTKGKKLPIKFGPINATTIQQMLGR